MKTPLLFAAVALGAASASAGVPEAVEPASIPAYRLIQPGLAAAGQPTPEALKGLGEMGFRTVVNLRPETEGPADERTVVEAQGLRYVSIPVTADTFSLADVEALERVLADPAAAPVLLHCASSNRVGRRLGRRSRPGRGRASRRPRRPVGPRACTARRWKRPSGASSACPPRRRPRLP